MNNNNTTAKIVASIAQCGCLRRAIWCKSKQEIDDAKNEFGFDGKEVLIVDKMEDIANPTYKDINHSDGYCAIMDQTIKKLEEENLKLRLSIHDALGLTELGVPVKCDECLAESSGIIMLLRKRVKDLEALLTECIDPLKRLYCAVEYPETVEASEMLQSIQAMLKEGK